MRASTLLLEIRKGWKGFLIFTAVVVLIAGGFPQLFPIVQEQFEEQDNGLEGQESVRLVAENSQLLLSWDFQHHGLVQEYRVIEDDAAHLATAELVGSTSAKNMTIADEDGDERYFAVIAVMDDSSQVPVGMASTAELKDPMAELMATPYLQIFTDGRDDLRMDDMAGFMSIELYSWLFLLVGTWLAYISARSVGGDFDRRRMDVVFSTPLMRRRYLAEKFLAISLMTFAVLMVSAAFMTLSVAQVGESGSLGAWKAFVSLLGAWPLFMFVIGLGFLFAALLRSARGAAALTFGVLLVQYVFNVAGHMIGGLSWLHTVTALAYWDYNSVLLDGVFVAGDFVLLLVLAALILLAAMILFDRMDIPA